MEQVLVFNHSFAFSYMNNLVLCMIELHIPEYHVVQIVLESWRVWGGVDGKVHSSVSRK